MGVPIRGYWLILNHRELRRQRRLRAARRRGSLGVSFRPRAATLCPLSRFVAMIARHAGSRKIAQWHNALIRSGGFMSAHTCNRPAITSFGRATVQQLALLVGGAVLSFAAGAATKDTTKTRVDAKTVEW